MIVDDNAGVRKMIRSFIADLVDEFTECEDGEGALEAYMESLPDVVLMDIKLKATDGFTATNTIKSAYPTARVWIVSQLDNPALRTRAKLAGAEAYINKADLRPLKDLLTAKTGSLFEGHR